MAMGDVQSQLARANFQKANFDQQLGYRQAAEQAQRDSMDKLISMGGMAALGAGAGGLGALSGLGIEAGGMGALQGGMAGLTGDFGMFKPSSGLLQGANITLPGSAEAVDTGDTGIGDLTPEELAVLKKLMGGE